jgi:Holliday junction resolvase - archaeal type
MINGNQKGKAGERELAAELRERGFAARRAQQYSGTDGSQDIKHDLPGVHLECKRVERLNVLNAYLQAQRDAQAGGLMPVVAHRCNRSPWLVTLSLDDFLQLVRGEDLLA